MSFEENNKENASNHSAHTMQDEVDIMDKASHSERIPYDVLQKQLAEAEEKVTQHWDRILRQQADMGNLQRRSERDIANAHKYSLEKFVLELLPVVDNLERALTAHHTEASGEGTLLDGVKLTLKLFQDVLQKFAVEQVDPLNRPFNPELHQAVSTQTDTNAPVNSVVSVLQKGYLLNERLIRPALVIVAK